MTRYIQRRREQTEQILNGRPNVSHPYYSLTLTDAIAIALNSVDLCSREAVCTTLEDVHDELLAIWPSHTWITGAVATELIDAVLAFSPTTYTASQGGALIAVRAAGRHDLEGHPDAYRRGAYFCSLADGSLVPDTTLDELAINRTFYLSDEPNRPIAAGELSIDPTWIRAALAQHLDDDGPEAPPAPAA